MSPRINRELSTYLDYVPLCLAVGGLVFKGILAPRLPSAIKTDYSLDIFTLFLSCLNFIIPSLTINKCCFKINIDTTNQQTYDKARLYFNCEYDRSNPLTKKKAMKRWYDFQ